MAKKALLLIIGLCLTIGTGMVVSTPAFAQPIELTVNDHNPPPSTGLGCLGKMG